MKIRNFAALIGIVTVVLGLVGCIATQDGKHQAGVPFVNDSLEGRYERPPDQVYDAAKAVLLYNGTLINESRLHTSTNAVQTLEGKVNQRTVWIRIEALDPKITSVVVQARTKGGWKDINLVHELEKQIALKLSQ